MSSNSGIWGGIRGRISGKGKTKQPPASPWSGSSALGPPAPGPGSSRSNPPIPAESPVQSAPLSSEKFGLFEFPSKRPTSQAAVSPPPPQNANYVDIVAVHGLGGNWQSTWTGEDGAVWLRDRLPGVLAEANIVARVRSFGYDSATVFNRSVGDLQTAGKSLLLRLSDFRTTPQQRTSPIILVCHSLGGLVVKEALVQAWNRSSQYQDVLDNVKACLFLGVPHRGSSLANWAKTPADAFKMLSMGFAGNSNFVGVLKKNSKDWVTLADNFVERADNLHIRSFYETEKYGNLIVVDKSSAVMHIRNESAFPLDGSNHRTICKFRADEDQRFSPVGHAILDLAKLVLPSEAPGPLSAPIPDRDTHSDAVPHHYIPLPKNQHFVGRKTTLDKLEEFLFVRPSQRVAVVGLGGVGKTQVALRVAYWTKESIPDFSVFWLPALSDESFDQACAEIVTKFAIQKTADDEDPRETLRRHLSLETAGKWLLIVDNADDRDLLFGPPGKPPGGINKSLPSSKEGIVLFTTRSQEIAVSVAGPEVVDLDEMDPQEAKRLFEELLIRKDHPPQNEALTTKLLRELTYLPLAISQAAAYINIKKVPIAEYLELLHGTEQDMIGLMSKEFPDNTRYYAGMKNAVATTWLVSFDQIRKSEEAAAELLSFISCIEPKGIPQSLLPVPSSKSKQQLVDAIGTLCAYAFLTRRGDSKVFDMHSLVHLATRIWVQEEDGTATAIKKATRHLAAIFPYNDHHANRGQSREYLPHAFRILQQKEEIDIAEKSDLYDRVGQFLRVDGRIREAVEHLEQACQGRSHLAEDHTTRLESQHMLAVAYEADGQVKKAIKLLEHVVAIQEGTLTKDHPNWLTSQYELARAYKADGQVKKAIELLEYIVAIEKETLAEDHPNRLSSQHALAGAYDVDGQVKKAVQLLEHVVAIREGTLAEDHPDRLASQHKLAMAYMANGQIKKAVELLEHVNVIQEGTLAEYHPNRLASQHTLAKAYRANGEVKNAVRLLEHVVAIREGTLAEDHHDQLVSQHELAMAYYADGQVKNAIKLLEHVVTVEETTLAKDHPDRLASQAALTYILQRAD